MKNIPHAEELQLCTVYNCITLYKSVGNPGHSVRGLRNHAKAVIWPRRADTAIWPRPSKPGLMSVCVALGPHGGGPGPLRGPQVDGGAPDSQIHWFRGPWRFSATPRIWLRQVVRASVRRQESSHPVVVIGLSPSWEPGEAIRLETGFPLCQKKCGLRNR